MRPQITTYLHADTRRWLERYSKRVGLTQSETLRLLVEREQMVRWLEWAMLVPDPAQAQARALLAPEDKISPRWNKPPKTKTRATRRKD